MSYTDLTETFTYNRRAIYSEFQALAQNATDAHTALYNEPVGAYDNTGTSVPTATNKRVDYDTEEYDPDGVFNAFFQYVPTVAGIYLVVGSIRLNAIITTGTQLEIQLHFGGNDIKRVYADALNGADGIYNKIVLPVHTQFPGTGAFNFYFYAARQNGGSTEALEGGSLGNYFAATRICYET